MMEAGLSPAVARVADNGIWSSGDRDGSWNDDCDNFMRLFWVREKDDPFRVSVLKKKRSWIADPSLFHTPLLSIFAHLLVLCFGSIWVYTAHLFIYCIHPTSFYFLHLFLILYTPPVYFVHLPHMIVLHHMTSVFK